MKNFFLIAVIVALSLSATFSRADNAYPNEKNNAPSAGMTEKNKSMPMAKMQENMLRMHELMHKIMDAKNPQEREQLMQEHAKMMQSSMSMMQGMMAGHGMMGGDAKDGKMDSGMKGM
ncbi:MAG: hypothetical protein HY081_00655 [Gammaproteobacteria bacterium]|nr:hypothetical protein [Gammaproteobacteria bacterium]